MNLILLLQDLLQQDLIQYLGFQIKEKDQGKIWFAANCVVHSLVWKITKTAKLPKKAAKLAAALARDHDGRMLEDPIGYWSRDDDYDINERTMNGNGILYHNVGVDRTATANTIVEWTDLSKSQINTLMELLAPLVMGAMGYLKSQKNYTAEALVIALQKEIGNYAVFEYIINCLENGVAIKGDALRRHFEGGRSKPAMIDRSVKEVKSSRPKAVKEDHDEVDHEQFMDVEKTGQQKVQTGFSEVEPADEALDPNLTLRNNHSYYFWLEVSDEVIKNAIDDKAVALPTDEIPDATKLKVAIFTLANHFILDPKADTGELKLDTDKRASVLRQPLSPTPSGITEDLTKRRLFFPVHTIARTGHYTLLCNIYYENILIQSRQVSAQVTASPQQVRHALLTELDYSIAQKLSAESLGKHKKHLLSVLLQEDDNSHSFQFFGGRQFKNATNFDMHETEEHLNRVRGGLRKVAWGDEKEWDGQRYRYTGHLSEAGFTSDLALLAIRGYQFYDAIINRLSNDMDKELKEAMKTPGYVQVALQKGARTVLPLALLYDQAIDTTIKLENFKLCDVFSSAVHNKQSLEKIACFQGNCPHAEEDEVICPSGFWGFRHYLGMPHTSGQNTTAPSEIFYQDHPEFSMSVSSDKNFVMRRGHEQNLNKFIKSDWVSYANNRDKTFDNFKNKQPHLVYFYCHGGFTSTKNPVLLVGNHEPISRDNIRAKGIEWNESHPLVFINGCHTAALRPSYAMEFVSAFVENAEAAGVIGTEITIFEPLATAFAEAFFERFINGEPAGKAIRNSRLDLLQKGNPLGLVYIPYVISGLQLVQGTRG